MDSDKLLSKHPDLLIKVLKHSPDLWFAAIVAAYARDRRCSEVKDADGWLRLAAKGKKSIRCDDTLLTLAQVKRFFPPAFYPCKGEDDLIRKVIIAAAHGREQHVREDNIKARKAHG